MSIRELPPIREQLSFYDRIEQEILKVFKTEIYLPLLKEINFTGKILTNSKDNSLLRAIQIGKVSVRVTRDRAIISGEFDAGISKEILSLGGEFNRVTKMFELPVSQLTFEIKQAIQLYKSQFTATLKKIDQKLASILPIDISDKLKLEKLFDKTLFQIDKEFVESVKSISIQPQITTEQRKVIATNYTESLKLPIKDFITEQVSSLRKQVERHVVAGGRRDDLAKMIKESYGVSERKAKFLAKQETSLMMSSFKQARYQEIGIDEYYWRSVKGTPAHPVRPMHKELNDRSARGEVFRFSNPPVDDPNGSRHNPGQNYGPCRCVAVPIVRF